MSDNTPQSFISDSPKSYLVELSDDLHPQYEISWKMEDKPAEAVDAEEWIGKKGFAAKGKKCSAKGEIKSVRFIEPLVKEDDSAPEAGQAETESIDLELPDAAGLSADTLQDLSDAPDEETYEEPTLF